MLGRVRDCILRWYVRTPEHPMKYRIVQWLGRHGFPERGILTVAHPGLQFRLHPRDWIEYRLLSGEAYEPLTLAFLSANLRSGDTAVLAGVNFGQHVATAARAVGPSGRVIGVEPQPSALLKAWETLQLNGLQRCVTLVAAALGSEDDILPMTWSDPRNAGAASLLDTGDGLYVPVLRLPQVLQAVGSPQVRMLLLDVQGFEANVLNGLEGAPLPEIVVVEIDDSFIARSGLKPRDLLCQIESMGYALWCLDGTPAAPTSVVFPERNVVGLRSGVCAVWTHPPKTVR